MIAVTCPSLQVYHASTTMELRKICASISGRPVVFVRVSFTPNVRVIALFRFCRTITDSQPYITSIDSLIAQVSSHDASRCEAPSSSDAFYGRREQYTHRSAFSPFRHFTFRPFVSSFSTRNYVERCHDTVYYAKHGTDIRWIPHLPQTNLSADVIRN